MLCCAVFWLNFTLRELAECDPLTYQRITFPQGEICSVELQGFSLISYCAFGCNGLSDIAEFFQKNFLNHVPISPIFDSAFYDSDLKLL